MQLHFESVCFIDGARRSEHVPKRGHTCRSKFWEFWAQSSTQEQTQCSSSPAKKRLLGVPFEPPKSLLGGPPKLARLREEMHLSAPPQSRLGEGLRVFLGR